MNGAYEILVKKALKRLGVDNTDKRRLVRITDHVMNAGLKDYVNLKASKNNVAMKELFFNTQPKINIRDSDEDVTKQLLTKCENFSSARVDAAAKNCMYVVLNEILHGFSFAELIIGGAKDGTLTSRSDLDIPVVTNCSSWGQCQLATVTCIVALSELYTEIPCGACTRVFSEEQMLTNSSLSQHYVKTAVLVPEPIYNDEAFFTHFEEVSYAKLKKMAIEGEETVNGIYRLELEDYSAKIRRKIENSPSVSTKDMLKVTTIDLARCLAQVRGINALRGVRFGELYSKALKIHPSLECLAPLLGTVIKQANGDPDEPIAVHKVTNQISKLLDTLQSWESQSAIA